MTIELTKSDLEKFVTEQVSAGRFSSPTEVIEAGLARLMLDPELDADLDRAEAEYERGEHRPFEEVAAELRRKYLTK